MAKEVALKKESIEQTALAIQAEAKERALALQELGVETKDLVIASIQVMQGTSALVGDEKAKVGEIVNMQTEEILGGVDKPIKILPLKMYKTLRIYNVANSSFKFLREEPLTAKNDKLSNEAMERIQTEDGEIEVPVKRYHSFNFFVLLKTDMDKGEGFPCLIRFRSTGMNAGRTLATYLYKLVFFRKKPYSTFISLLTKKEKKETAVYGVPVIDTKNTLAATPEEIQAAEDWLAMLAAGNYKVDEREEFSEEIGTAAKPIVMGAEVVGSEQGEY